MVLVVTIMSATSRGRLRPRQDMLSPATMGRIALLIARTPRVQGTLNAEEKP